MSALVFGAVASLLAAPLAASAANNAPVATDDNWPTLLAGATQVSLATLLTLNDSDADGGILTFELASQPLHGDLNLGLLGLLTYKADVDYVGTDSFTYKAKDPQGNASNAATVHITMIGLLGNDDPYTAVSGTDLTVPAATGLLGNDLNPTNALLEIVLVAVTGRDPVWWTPRKRECSLWEASVGGEFRRWSQHRLDLTGSRVSR